MHPSDILVIDGFFVPGQRLRPSDMVMIRVQSFFMIRMRAPLRSIVLIIKPWKRLVMIVN